MDDFGQSWTDKQWDMWRIEMAKQIYPPKGTPIQDCKISNGSIEATKGPEYKFNEGALVAEIKAYIDKTYDAHYSQGKYQATEMIEDAGHGMGFAIGNIMKYAFRYGKKDGTNRADLLKVIHYGIIALAIHDRGGK